MPPAPSRLSICLVVLLLLPVLGCSASGAVTVSTPVPSLAATATPGASPPASVSEAEATDVPTSSPSATSGVPPSPPTAEPPATDVPPTEVPPTEAPPTPTAVPQGPIQFNPAQLVQGGSAIVYLTTPASSATLRFNEKQYPMLHDGTNWWTIIGAGAFMEPGLHPVSIIYTPSGSDESETVTASVAVLDREFPVEEIFLDEETASLLDPAIVQAEIQQRAAIYAGFTADRYWSGPFLPPAAGSISSIYGEGRSYNGGPVTDYHHGTDFIGNTGDPVHAAATGVVVFTGELRVRGNTIIIDHGAGVMTAYNHLSRIDVEEGQPVAAGDQIGAIGSTGLVTGPHLHWEVIVRGQEVDGQLWLNGGEIAP